MAEMTEGDARPECCRDERNLELAEHTKTPDGTLAKHVCQECGRRHFIATGDPVRFGVVGGG